MGKQIDELEEILIATPDLLILIDETLFGGEIVTRHVKASGIVDIINEQIEPKGTPRICIADSVPVGFLLMNGQAINATSSPVLHGIYGDNLLDLTGRVVVGSENQRGGELIDENVGDHEHTGILEDIEIEGSTSQARPLHGGAILNSAEKPEAGVDHDHGVPLVEKGADNSGGGRQAIVNLNRKFDVEVRTLAPDPDHSHKIHLPPHTHDISLLPHTHKIIQKPMASSDKNKIDTFGVFYIVKDE